MHAKTSVKPCYAFPSELEEAAAQREQGKGFVSSSSDYRRSPAPHPLSPGKGFAGVRI